MAIKFEEFYDAFHSCNETKQFISKGKLSTSLQNLKTYHSVPKLVHVEQNVFIKPPFDQLLQLQHPDGRWKSLDLVLRCLGIPINNYLGDVEEWEQASAFAIAKIRQQYDMFHILGDSHDRAMEWFQSTKLISRAGEIMVHATSDSAETMRLSEHEVKKISQSFVEERRNETISKYLKSQSKMMSFMEIENFKTKQANMEAIDATNKMKLNRFLKQATIDYSSLLMKYEDSVEALKQAEVNKILNTLYITFYGILFCHRLFVTRCIYIS
jgi:hypothetical protein